MALKVPKNQVEAIKDLLQLPEGSLTALLDALSEAQPHFNRYDLADEAATKSKLDSQTVHGIVDVLASLYLTLRPGQSIEKFVDRTVQTSLRRAGLFEQKSGESAKIEESEWKRLSEFLKTALSYEKAIGSAAKSGMVLTRHERIYDGASLTTDFRPIFHREANENPDGGLVIHMLCIEQRDSGDNEQKLYFALDSNDVLQLKSVLERAIAKEETLKSWLNKAHIKVIEPKAFY